MLAIYMSDDYRGCTMSTNRPELLSKLNSLVNRYGGDDAFVSRMDEWPKTIKDLIYGSEKLMLRFKLVELITDHVDEEELTVGME